jgi:hypothetical protein
MATVVRSRAYLVLAAALTLFVLIGFARTYYLRPWFDGPPITYLLHVHAILFTAWLGLFAVQVVLISKHDYRTHMQLGIAGMALAVLVVVIGLVSSCVSAADLRPRPMGMTPAQFVLMPVSSIVLFGGLVLAAFLLRKRAALHKRLMVLAMIAVLGPPAARLIRLAELGQDFLAIQTSVAAIFVIGAVVADWLRHHALHPVYVIGGTLMVLSWPARVWLARTPAWEAVGQWMAAVGAG